MNSKYDGYPLSFNIYTAIEFLEDELSGAEEDRGHDTRTTELIRLLEHLAACEEAKPLNRPLG